MSYVYASEAFSGLGVRSWINASNWSTSIGGSRLDERVIEAMCSAASAYCDMEELMAVAGARVAELCGVEAAHITLGAAAGITLSVSACITGTDTRRMAKLQVALEGRETLADEVVMQMPHSSRCDCQYRTGGGKLVRVGVPAFVARHQIEDAITDGTACLAFVYSYQGPPRDLLFSVMAEIARERDLPFVVDNASIVPPKKNLHRFTDEGADLVVISGGKGIRGPNNTGMVLGGGRNGRRLIEAIREQSFPRYGIGRSFKVSKEAIVGLVVALELFVQQDEEATYRNQMEMARHIAGALVGIGALQVSVIPNDGTDFEHPVSARVPRVYLQWDAAEVGIDAPGLDRIMAAGDPPILLRPPRVTQANAVTSRSIRLIDTFCLREGEDAMVTERLREAFLRH